MATNIIQFPRLAANDNQRTYPGAPANARRTPAILYRALKGEVRRAA